jgi:hypothetical protein
MANQKTTPNLGVAAQKPSFIASLCPAAPVAPRSAPARP